MAGYNQHPRYANLLPAPGAHGRGGYQIGGRGQGKKGNGRYNNNNNRGSQSNGTYGPRPVSDMSAPMNFPQDHPVPWGSQFGGHPMPMPHVGDTGPWIPPAPDLGCPNNATAMMHLQGPKGYVDARSHLDSSSTNTPVYTPPIASPTAHITTRAAEFKASPAPTEVRLALKPSKNGLSVTWTEKAGTSKRAVAHPTDSTNGGAQAAPVDLTVHTTSTSDSSHVVPKSPECRNFAMDANHGTLDKTADQLDVEKIISLQVYNISLASKLRQTLQKAKSDHQVRENKIRAMQATARFELNLAINAESSAVATSSKLCDSFYHDMTEACKLDGDAKPAAQLRATKHLKSLTEFSHLASKERKLIDKFRNELQDLDNACARSRNTYSNTIFDVLMKALGAEAPELPAPSRKEETALSATLAKTHTVAKDEIATPESSSNSSKPKEDRQDSAAVTLPIDVQHFTQQPDQSKQQPVFERRPELEHRSIREILEGVNLVDKPDEGAQLGEKQKVKFKQGKEKQVVTPDVKVHTVSFTTEDTLAPKSTESTVSATAETRDKAKVSSLAPHADSDSNLVHLSSASAPQTIDQPQKLKKKKKKQIKKKKKAGAVGGDGVGMADAAPKTGPAGNGETTKGVDKADSAGDGVRSGGASKAGPVAGEVRKGG